MVMGGDSCSKGHEFESQCRILNGHFTHLFVVKIVIKMKKRPGLAHSLKKEIKFGAKLCCESGRTVESNQCDAAYRC